MKTKGQHAIMEFLSECLDIEPNGTYIRITLLIEDMPIYRTRKNEIATNVLRLCSHVVITYFGPLACMPKFYILQKNCKDYF